MHEEHNSDDEEESGRFRKLWSTVSGVVVEGLSEEKKQQIVNFGGKVGGVVTNLAHRVVEGLENAQEKIDSSLETLKLEHERFLHECDEEECSSSSSSSLSSSEDEFIPKLYTGRRRILPWEPYVETKEAFLQLFKDEENFRQGPPQDISYSLDVRKRKSLIMELFRHDPILLKAHARLAHKLGENIFWRNFFYHCALLRQRLGLDEGADDPRKDIVIVSPDSNEKKASVESPNQLDCINAPTFQHSFAPFDEDETVNTRKPSKKSLSQPTPKTPDFIQDDFLNDSDGEDYEFLQNGACDHDDFVLLNPHTLDSQPDLTALVV
mmetsp:Transcript_4908/g.6947  ORF Transcript_4908/g.6947 Transcript_4908/m.6947 type:complete len:323 (-) Transcript_4908:338-1306(-)|eukprot:CAMPEP_0197286766 /NCGR_PEP_ID=MMETSP0890-20130614/2411_1 /TAXON_ID=44058 ORGANISM="Aureoumbra lagunensis, Strain CCMP1510" /NCGR_SAMPLE_ID=MMETSP0890 /ASSEMBLY_ACC=CAM_ASM_000533 /LENGTH=322 /DNA_ID=CAMNT_0042755483 /DNA_START=67 /DNA_END=1035 /DNA_ORIENTATION=-